MDLILQLIHYSLGYNPQVFRQTDDDVLEPVGFLKKERQAGIVLFLFSIRLCECIFRLYSAFFFVNGHL